MVGMQSQAEPELAQGQPPVGRGIEDGSGAEESDDAHVVADFPVMTKQIIRSLGRAGRRHHHPVASRRRRTLTRKRAADEISSRRE